MRKVLIVDDEPRVGLLIKKLINWDDLNLELTAIVQNGLEAYHQIQLNKPDIVITDIRMPQMDGLQLIQKTREEKLDIHFIVISGYRHFEYAHSALKYGVEDYLLKPIEEMELNQVLKKICDKKKITEETKSKVEKLYHNIDKSKTILQKEFVESLISDKDRQEHIEEANYNYGLEFKRGFFEGIVVKVDRKLTIERSEKQEKLIQEKIIQIIQNDFKDKVIDYVLIPKNYLYFVAIFNYTFEAKEIIRKEIHELTSHLRDYVHEYENYTVTVGVGEEVSEFAQIRKTLAESFEAVQSRIIEGADKRIKCNTQNKHIEADEKTIIEAKQKEFRNIVETFQIEKIQSMVKDYFRQLKKDNVLANVYYDFAEELIYLFFDALPSQSTASAENQSSIWVEEVHHANTILSLSDLLVNKMVGYMTKFKEKQKESDRKPIQEAIQFMKKNYGKKIVLEDVALTSGFNANYFSELFKKETGKNFSDYLLEMRIEEAKKLLRDTNETIYEIAEKVGYKDSKFFSQQFTRSVGIKPTEYRKLYF